MYKKTITIFLSLGFVILAGALIFIYTRPARPVSISINNNTNQAVPPQPDNSNLIRVDSPLSDDTITSPLFVSGQARGTWFFEGSFPVILQDANGNIIAQGIATSSESWMTEDFVPFQAILDFNRPGTKTGRLVLKKDNPSGLPENDDQLVVPVSFGQNNITVKVFFTTAQTAGGPSYGCDYVAAVEKQIPKTEAVARTALEELLKGPNSQDKQAGFGTAINPNVQIQKLTIVDGVARADFNEQLEYQVGGSCRVTAISNQIVKTLKQFSTVKDVIISINGRTEDILQP